MMICDNKDCELWMHEVCLADDILTKAHDRLIEGGGLNAQTNSPSISAAKRGKPKRKVWRGEFGANFHTDASGHSTVIITDLRSNPKGPKTWTEKIACFEVQKSA